MDVVKSNRRVCTSFLLWAGLFRPLPLGRSPFLRSRRNCFALARLALKQLVCAYLVEAAHSVRWELCQRFH